jgi:putative tricarboxylic transport membrane protein
MYRLWFNLDAKRAGRALVGLIGMLVSIGYLTVAIEMPRGSAVAPGPGMFPVIVGWAAIVISLIVIVEAVLTSIVSGGIEWPEGKRRARVLIFLATLIGYVLALPLLGQYLTSSVYAALVLLGIGQLGILKSLTYGAIVGSGLSWFFISVMGLTLPAGFW